MYNFLRYSIMFLGVAYIVLTLLLLLITPYIIDVGIILSMLFTLEAGVIYLLISKLCRKRNKLSAMYAIALQVLIVNLLNYTLPELFPTSFLMTQLTTNGLLLFLFLFTKDDGVSENVESTLKMLYDNRKLNDSYFFTTPYVKEGKLYKENEKYPLYSYSYKCFKELLDNNIIKSNNI